MDMEQHIMDFIREALERAGAEVSHQDGMDSMEVSVDDWAFTVTASDLDIVS